MLHIEEWSKGMEWILVIPSGQMQIIIYNIWPVGKRTCKIYNKRHFVTETLYPGYSVASKANSLSRSPPHPIFTIPPNPIPYPSLNPLIPLFCPVTDLLSATWEDQTCKYCVENNVHLLPSSGIFSQLLYVSYPQAFLFIHNYICIPYSKMCFASPESCIQPYSRRWQGVGPHYM